MRLPPPPLNSWGAGQPTTSSYTPLHLSLGVALSQARQVAAAFGNHQTPWELSTNEVVVIMFMEGCGS